MRNIQFKLYAAEPTKFLISLRCMYYSDLSKSQLRSNPTKFLQNLKEIQNNFISTNLFTRLKVTIFPSILYTHTFTRQTHHRTQTIPSIPTRQYHTK